MERKTGLSSWRDLQVLIQGGSGLAPLIGVGFPALPLGIDGRVIDKAYFDHGITQSMLGRIYKLIASPKAIYKSSDGPGLVVLTYEIKGADPIIIPVHPNKQMTRAQYFNMVASVYAKESKGGAPIEDRWKKGGLLLWEAPPQGLG